MKKDIEFSDYILGAAIEDFLIANPNVKQKELADAIGITQSLFAKYKSGLLATTNLTKNQKQTLVEKLGLFLTNKKNKLILSNFKNFALFGEPKDVKKFIELTDADGKSILGNCDEFGYSVFDYLVKYRNLGKRNQDKLLRKILLEREFEYQYSYPNSYFYSSQSGQNPTIYVSGILADELLKIVASSDDDKLLRQLFNDQALESICYNQPSKKSDKNPFDLFVEYPKLLEIVTYEGCYRLDENKQKHYISYKEAYEPTKPFIIPPIASKLLEYFLEKSLDKRDIRYIKAAKILLEKCTVLNENISRLLDRTSDKYVPSRTSLEPSLIYKAGKAITPSSIPVAGYLYCPSEKLKEYLNVDDLSDVLEKFIETVKTSFLETSDRKKPYFEDEYPLPDAGSEEAKALQLLKDNGLNIYFEGTIKNGMRVISLDNGLTKLNKAQPKTIEQLGQLYKEANKIKDPESRTLCLGSIKEKTVLIDTKTGDIKYLCDLSNAHFGIPEDDLCDFIFEYNQNYYYPNQQKSISTIEEIIKAFGSVEMEPEKLYELLWEKIHKKIEECRLKTPYMIGIILDRARRYCEDKDKIIELFEKQKRKALGK